MSFQLLTIIKLSGLAGILGALIMGTGDLMYHHIPGSKLTPPERMSSLPLKRLVSAGALGLVGSWLYVFSIIHVYFAFIPIGEDLTLAITVSFAMVMIAYGSAHTAYYAIGSSAKVANEHGSDVKSAGKIGEALYSRLVIITYVPVAIASVLS